MSERNVLAELVDYLLSCYETTVGVSVSVSKIEDHLLPMDEEDADLVRTFIYMLVESGMLSLKVAIYDEDDDAFIDIEPDEVPDDCPREQLKIWVKPDFCFIEREVADAEEECEE